MNVNVCYEANEQSEKRMSDFLKSSYSNNNKESFCLPLSKQVTIVWGEGHKSNNKKNNYFNNNNNGNNNNNKKHLIITRKIETYHNTRLSFIFCDLKTRLLSAVDVIATVS